MNCSSSESRRSFVFQCLTSCQCRPGFPTDHRPVSKRARIRGEPWEHPKTSSGFLYWANQTKTNRLHAGLDRPHAIRMSNRWRYLAHWLTVIFHASTSALMSLPVPHCRTSIRHPSARRVTIASRQDIRPTSTVPHYLVPLSCHSRTYSSIDSHPWSSPFSSPSSLSPSSVSESVSGSSNPTSRSLPSPLILGTLLLKAARTAAFVLVSQI